MKELISLSGVKAIDANHYQSMALLNNGQVITWGDNGYGQLGIGNTTDNANPTIVNTNSGISSISAGYYHTIAIDSDGTLEAWGRNANYQLGDNSTSQRNSPVDSSNGLNSHRATGILLRLLLFMALMIQNLMVIQIIQLLLNRLSRSMVTSTGLIL